MHKRETKFNKARDQLGRISEKKKEYRIFRFNFNFKVSAFESFHKDLHVYGILRERIENNKRGIRSPGFFNRYQMRKGEIYVNRRRFKKKKPQGSRKDI